jgi:hypothetical protein
MTFRLSPRVAVALAAFLALSGAPRVANAARGDHDGPRRSREPALNAPGELVVGTHDDQAAFARTRQVAEWLTEEMARPALDAPVVVRLTADEQSLLESPDPADPRLRVGLVKEVGRSLDLTGLAEAGAGETVALPLGAARRTADGGHVWTAVVQSPGARALRVHFTGFSVPPQAAVWIHDLDGQAHGPYTGLGPDGQGEFWSHNVMGDALVVELRHAGPATARDLAATRLTIADLGHSGPLFWPGASFAAAKSFCTFNASCVENAECHGSEDFGSIEDVQRAVAMIQFVSGAFLYSCSGGLLADTDQSSVIPYFLTANHCVSRGREASTLQTYFDYTAACGTSSCPAPGPYSTRGARILGTNRTGDYTLLRLDSTPGGDRFYMGWNTTPVANSNGAALHRISHPSAGPQAYSGHHVDASAPTCSSWPRGPWIYSRDDVGATEGGSSGSPVTDAAGDVVGQLSGGCGYNVNDVCDATSNATVDGAFASYYQAISGWLDPTPCSPSAEVCDDGTDDDCDGAADCADSDCAGDPACSSGGCDLGHNGDSCSVSDDCCSGNCRGGRCRGN